MQVATPPAEPRLHASPRVVRLLSVVFGALPATWLAALAALVFLGALDGIAAHPVARSLSALWGLAGVLGAIGGWLIVFDVGARRIGRRGSLFSWLLQALPRLRFC